MSRNSRAFTLVELLVALAIFALISGFAYRGLNAMLESREALQKDARKWRDVALFVGRFERDLGAVLMRTATGSSGTPLPPVSSTLDTPSQGEGLAVTRSGSPLQENALAAPQRIAYRYRDGHVERLSWASMSAAAEAATATMSTAVTAATPAWRARLTTATSAGRRGARCARRSRARR